MVDGVAVGAANSGLSELSEESILLVLLPSTATFRAVASRPLPCRLGNCGERPTYTMAAAATPKTSSRLEALIPPEKVRLSRHYCRQKSIRGSSHSSSRSRSNRGCTSLTCSSGSLSPAELRHSHSSHFVRPSVRLSVRPSVRSADGPTVSPSVSQLFRHSLAACLSRR